MTPKETNWDDWELEEDDPYIFDPDDLTEEPRKFSDEELASLFGPDDA